MQIFLIVDDFEFNVATSITFVSMAIGTDTISL